MPKDKAHPVEDDSRRMFLKLGVHGLGAGVAAVTVAPAIAYLAFPLNHETTTGASGFIPAARADRFKEGEPVKVDLVSDKMDAWNRIEQIKIGSAWVLKQGGKLVAFSSVCPHLGCPIDCDTNDHKFKCPCHRSVFNYQGKVESGPAPRPMDELEVKEVNGVLAIRYQRFKQGAEEKQAV